MAVKPKKTKRSPRAKKQVAEPEVKINPVAIFKLSSGEEIVAYVDTEQFQAEGVMIAYNPMAVMTMESHIVMIPFGMAAAEKDVFQFPMTQISWIFEVSEDVDTLYHASMKVNRNTSQEYFDQCIFNSLQMLKRKVARSKEPGPSNEELETIEKEKEKKFTSSADVDVDETDAGRVDRLAALAEAAGKGRNAKV